MAWRVESRTDRGRWVAHDGQHWTADDETRPHMIALASGPQLLTPTGPTYTPAGPGDETGVFLAAMSIVPAPMASGALPDIPRLPEAPTSPETVY